MAKEFSRTRRVADQIQRNMAELIQMELGDPRLGMVTVTAVEVTKEFESARVFFTVLGKELGDNSQIEETAAALNHAAGFLRSALAKRLKLRTTPKLIFVYDSSMERGNQLTDLINSAVTKPTGNKSEDS
jgi:ribosome-binding factor A